MIISKIDAGLGNQMFQYAYGFSQSRNNNTEFFIEHHAYKFRPRSYQLNNFNITAKIIELPVAYRNNKISKLIAEIKRRLILKFKYKVYWQKEGKTDAQCYNKKYTNLTNKNVYCEGYYQSIKYFEKYKNELAQEFKIKPNVISKKAQNLINEVMSTNSIAIHIRKGDYPQEWLINPKFYNIALDKMKSLVGKDAIIYVFCENYDYALNILKNEENIRIITGQYNLTDIEEFALLKACKNQIISNSTFSWWAAYLNEYSKKNIIAPVFSMWRHEFYPNEWIKIDMNKL